MDESVLKHLRVIMSEVAKGGEKERLESKNRA